MATPAASSPTQEQIDKDPPQFAAKSSFKELQPYEASGPFADVAAAMTGPFGVAVRGIRLTDAEPRTLEFELRATGTNVPNLYDNASAMMSLYVTSARSTDGKELLRVERCGRERNSSPASGVRMGGNVQATKTVRMIEAASQAQLQAIAGHVRLRLPTAVETVSMPKPKAGDRIDRDGVRVQLTQIDSSTIAYRVSGAAERVLHVRAKNARGEVLSRGFSMSSGSDGAVSTRTEFKGAIASLEWIFAQQIEQQDFPFEIVRPRVGAKEGWSSDSVTEFRPYTKAELTRDLSSPVLPKRYNEPLTTASSGPMVLDLEQVGSFGHTRLDLALFTPKLRNLNGALTAAQIEVDSIAMRDGTVHHPGNGQWRSNVLLKQFGNDPYHGRTAIDTGLEIPRESVATIVGRIFLRAPSEFATTTLSIGEVGTSTGTECGPISLVEVAADSFSIEGIGELSCLYAVRVLSSAGKEIPLNDADINARPAMWRARLNANGSPDHIELIAGKKIQVLEFPFTLRVPQSGVH